MVAHSRPGIDSLLSLCAILRQFDRDLLLALAGCDDDAVVSLLRGDLVAPAPGPVDAYCLREEVRAEVLAGLRAERPIDELALHTRAFEHFLGRLEQGQPGERRPADEDACFEHLDTLFHLLLPRFEWQTIHQHAVAARAAAPVQARHRQRLALYEGYAATRMQEYERGETLLATLLGEPDLEPDVRVHALNALAAGHFNQRHHDRAQV